MYRYVCVCVYRYVCVHIRRVGGEVALVLQERALVSVCILGELGVNYYKVMITVIVRVSSCTPRALGSNNYVLTLQVHDSVMGGGI